MATKMLLSRGNEQAYPFPLLYTTAAKLLVESMKDSNPHEWWWSEFVDKDYNSKNLTGR